MHDRLDSSMLRPLLVLTTVLLFTPAEDGNMIRYWVLMDNVVVLVSPS